MEYRPECQKADPVVPPCPNSTFLQVLKTWTRWTTRKTRPSVTKRMITYVVLSLLALGLDDRLALGLNGRSSLHPWESPSLPSLHDPWKVRPRTYFAFRLIWTHGFAKFSSTRKQQTQNMRMYVNHVNVDKSEDLRPTHGDSSRVHAERIFNNLT